MNPDHYQFDVGINLHSGECEPYVLFSGEGKPLPSHKMGPSSHNFHLLHTVLAGRGGFTSGGTSYPCGPGDTFVIFPGIMFSYEADRDLPWHYVWVGLQGTETDRVLENIGITPENPVLHLPRTGALYDLYRSVRGSFRQSAYPYLESLEASGWAKLLLHRLGSDNIASLPALQSGHQHLIDRQIDQAIRWISLQYQQSISIESMASALGYHRAHLSKAFKARTGLSPKQFLMHVRINKAKELLGGSFSIEQVASAVGFNDNLYFSRQFRKETGMSPSDYRASVQAESP